MKKPNIAAEHRAEKELYAKGRREEAKGNYEKALLCYNKLTEHPCNPLYIGARDRAIKVLAPKPAGYVTGYDISMALNAELRLSA